MALCDRLRSLPVPRADACANRARAAVVDSIRRGGATRAAPGRRRLRVPHHRAADTAELPPVTLTRLAERSRDPSPPRGGSGWRRITDPACAGPVLHQLSRIWYVRETLPPYVVLSSDLSSHTGNKPLRQTGIHLPPRGARDPPARYGRRSTHQRTPAHPQ